MLYGAAPGGHLLAVPPAQEEDEEGGQAEEEEEEQQQQHPRVPRQLVPSLCGYLSIKILEEIKTKCRLNRW